MTTDTATKTIAVTETFGRDVVTMAGVAKVRHDSPEYGDHVGLLLVMQYLVTPFNWP
ncbi:MAG: hypothetical protein ACLS36_02135 [Streptococcus sp.]